MVVKLNGLTPPPAPVDPQERMLALLRSFPALATFPHPRWDAQQFAAWAAEHCTGRGATVHAAHFVLAVADPDRDWGPATAGLISGPFRLLDAWPTWDRAAREAARSWLDAPFHP